MKTNVWKYLGPGLLYAGAAVGVSHLVQSTRAGAVYGLELLPIVLLANILKFPFFEVGTRYTLETGQSLLDGYEKEGRWALWVFYLVSVGTMCIIVATVTLVTTGIFQNIAGVALPPWVMATLVLSACAFLLGGGRFQALDLIMKWIVVGLTLSTILALVFSFFGSVPRTNSTPGFIFDLGKVEDVSFLIALLGWMPIPVEAAVWQSEWTLAKKKEIEANTDYETNKRWVLFDFHLGYWGTTILAVFFLLLGAQMMFSTGKTFSNQAVAFASELIQIYTDSLGEWARPVILMAAFFTMFSTTITCFDAYPRVVSDATERIFPATERFGLGKQYWFWLGFVFFGSIGILYFFLTSMKGLVDFATSVSFLTAPILATIHHRILFSKNRANKPGNAYFLLSCIGLVFLYGFSTYFLKLRFFS